MTAGETTRQAPVALTAARLRREARQAAWDASRAGFPARPAPDEWLATRLRHDAVLSLITRPPFTAPHPGTRCGQIRGANLALDWLAGHPGGTWQQRWLASGAENAGRNWKQDCAGWLDIRGIHARQRMDLLSAGLILAICADIVRPGMPWLTAAGVSAGALARNLERTRDQAGLARLRAALDGTGPAAAGARHATLGRAAAIMAAKGGTLAEIAAGDFLELLDAEREVHGRLRNYSAVSWRLLRQAGAFGQRAPESLAQLLTIGQRSPAELIGRYQLTCRPVRDLIIDYLQERQPALDYRSPDTLAQHLGRNFWADLERHHPGISSLNLPSAVAAAWKQRMRTRPGDADQPGSQRLASRHTLISVRAFYLDLACWAAEDPARWGQWAVPSPVSRTDIGTRKEDRRRKSRMDSRTRERLPLLPVLTRSAAARRDHTARTLQASLAVPPGGTFTVKGQSFTRAAPRRPGIRIWAHDSDGKYHDLTREEDHAFWTWAIIEVLRATGIFSAGHPLRRKLISAFAQLRG